MPWPRTLLDTAQVRLCRDFGDTVVNDPGEGLERAERMLKVTEMALDSTTGRLPETPDEAKVEKYLRHVRATLLEGR